MIVHASSKNAYQSKRQFFSLRNREIFKIQSLILWNILDFLILRHRVNQIKRLQAHADNRDQQIEDILFISVCVRIVRDTAVLVGLDTIALHNPLNSRSSVDYIPIRSFGNIADRDIVIEDDRTLVVVLAVLLETHLAYSVVLFGDLDFKTEGSDIGRSFIVQVQLSKLSADLHIFRGFFKCRDTHHFFCKVIRIGFCSLER